MVHLLHGVVVALLVDGSEGVGMRCLLLLRRGVGDVHLVGFGQVGPLRLAVVPCEHVRALHAVLLAVQVHGALRGALLGYAYETRNLKARLDALERGQGGRSLVEDFACGSLLLGEGGQRHEGRCEEYGGCFHFHCRCWMFFGLWRGRITMHYELTPALRGCSGGRGRSGRGLRAAWNHGRGPRCRPPPSGP